MIKFYVIAKTDYANKTIYIIIFQIINYYKNYARLNKDKKYCIGIDLDIRPVKIEQIKKEIKHILNDHYDIIEEK